MSRPTGSHLGCPRPDPRNHARAPFLASLDVGLRPDGPLVVIGSSDASARLWDGKEGKLINVLRGPRERITHVAFAPDGKAVLTASADGSARLWPIWPDKPLSELSEPLGRASVFPLMRASSRGSELRLI